MLITKHKRELFPIIFFVILFLYTLSMIVPMVWTFITSVKDVIDFTMNKFGLPDIWMFSNYTDAFKGLYVEVSTSGGMRNVYMWELFGNTIIYAVGSTLVATFTHCTSAYVVAKYNFKLKSVIYSTVIVTMILPIVGSTPSLLQLMRGMGIYDKLLPIILKSGTFTGMSFLIFYGTFKSIAKDYAEAAFIDGAGHWTVMLKVMLPLAKVTIFILMLTAFISVWNDYTTPLIVMPSTPTISYGLYCFQFSKTNEIADIPHLMAACTLVILPILILFLIFKEQLIGNLTMGGLKG